MPSSHREEIYYGIDMKAVIVRVMMWEKSRCCDVMNERESNRGSDQLIVNGRILPPKVAEEGNVIVCYGGRESLLRSQSSGLVHE
jgi:hypothetical protein